MQKLFVPFDIAIELKILGFSEQCFGEYRQWDGCNPWLQIYQDGEGAEGSFTIECLAPLYQQVINWLREKHIRIIEVPGAFEDSWMVVIDIKHPNPPKIESGFMSLDKAIENVIKTLK